MRTGESILESVAFVLRKDRALQAGVLRKPSVEGDQVVVGRPGEGGQEGIVPDVGREGTMLGVASPEWHKAIRLGGERDARVVEDHVVQRHAVASVTASAPSAFGFVASRRNPCCVRRQNEHPSLDDASNQSLAAA